MSPTMILGRVVLPVVGVAMAGVLVWQLAVAKSASSSSSPVINSWDETTLAERKLLADGATIVAEGRVVPDAGGRVVVSAEIAGTIASVAVREKAVVKKGELLVEFKSDEVAPSLREAAAQLVEAENQLTHCVREGVDLDLAATKATSASERDAAKHDITAARARRDAAKANVERLEIVKAKYRIVAPMAGVVTSRQIEPGETVQFAAPLITIVDLKRLRIEAEVDEFDIGRCGVGTNVKITAEGYPGKSWQGQVEEIADAVVGRDLRPEDPSRPSDTNVLPVKIKLREPCPLKLGQRVETRIAVSTEP